MERCVTDKAISRVLILLDARYAERADQREGGVGTETLIISPQVYSKADQEKFIPVIMERRSDGSAPLPTYLADRIYIDLSDPETESEQYQRLVRNIFGKPERERPPLGTPPGYLRDGAVQLATGRSLAIYKDAVHRGRSNPVGYLEDYLDRLHLAFTSERIENPASELPLDELVVGSIDRFLPYRDEYLELLRFMCRHVNDPNSFERLHVFFERLLNLRYQTQSTAHQREFQTENIAWLTWELFLYTTAILLESGRFTELGSLLQAYYVETGRSGRGAMRDFSTLNPGFHAIDRIRKERLNLNYYSLSIRMVRERLAGTGVSFQSLMAADLVLWYRAAASGERWFPRTLYYGEDSETPSIFVRATSRRYFERLAPALGVSDRDDFARKFAALPDGAFPEAGHFWGGRDAYARFLNLEQLATRD
jgi:hypothetical protein